MHFFSKQHGLDWLYNYEMVFIPCIVRHCYCILFEFTVISGSFFLINVYVLPIFFKFWPH